MLLRRGCLINPLLSFQNLPTIARFRSLIYFAWLLASKFLYSISPHFWFSLSKKHFPVGPGSLNLLENDSSKNLFWLHRTLFSSWLWWWYAKSSRMGVCFYFPPRDDDSSVVRINESYDNGWTLRKNLFSVKWFRGINHLSNWKNLRIKFVSSLPDFFDRDSFFIHFPNHHIWRFHKANTLWFEWFTPCLF